MKTLQKKTRHCKSFAVTTPNIVSLINNGHRPNARKQVGTTKTTVSFLKNITYFLSFLILGFGSELKAQESVDKDVKPHNWEIGLDISPGSAGHQGLTTHLNGISILMISYHF